MVNAAPNDDLRARLCDKARALGFVEIGFASAALDEERESRLRDWLDAGYHAGMEWMARDPAVRANPRAMWPQARSVITVAMSYAPQSDPLALEGCSDRARISVYARSRDYHLVMKKRLKTLARWLVETAPKSALKLFVDTAPVMEKPLAARAGLGWQGKHTNLVSRRYGNWLFLGAIYTNLEFTSDEPQADLCGSCKACQSACPTNAFVRPYVLDAGRCISYLTIEHKGPVDRALRPALGNRIYGCDDCLAVCPWNKFASAAQAHRAFLPRAELEAPRLADLLALDDAGFRALFSGSPIKRIGRNRFVRNCLYAAGNAASASLRNAVVALVNDPDPVVSEAATWALERIAQAQDEAPSASSSAARSATGKRSDQ